MVFYYNFTNLCYQGFSEQYVTICETWCQAYTYVWPGFSDLIRTRFRRSNGVIQNVNEISWNFENSMVMMVSHAWVRFLEIDKHIYLRSCG